MTDDATPLDVPASPGIVVGPSSTTKDWIWALVRMVVIASGVFTMLSGFISKHDLAGFINYIQSSAFIVPVATLVSGFTAIWGVLKTRHLSIQVFNVASNPRVPDDIAKVSAK